MKVKITDDTKKYLTLAELPKAKKIIEMMKEDMSAAEAIEMAARCWYRNTEKIRDANKETSNGWLDCFEKVLDANARIAGNARAWNAYDDDSEHLDVWLEGTAQGSYGFLKIGCYLTDVWNIGASDEYNQGFPALCYVRYFPEAKLNKFHD